MPRRPLASAFITLSLLFALVPVRAQEAPVPADPEPAPALDFPRFGWSITPGIGVRVMSLDVERRSDGFTGTLTNDGSFTDPIYLSLDIETPSWMLSEKVGISLRNHSQTMRLSRQQVPSSTTTSGNDYADLGTRVQGYFSYLGPLLFYRMAEVNGDSRFGLGYAYWKTWFNGDIILAPDGAATAGMPRTKIDGTIDGTTGPTLFWQTRGNRYLFEMAISYVNFSAPGFHYTLRELVMNLGYQIRF